MASPTRNRLDYLYITFFTISLVSMLLIDLVHLLPPSLWIPPTSPLHPLHTLRTFYTTTYQDLYFLTPWSSQPRFFRLFTILELVFQLPAATWILRRFYASKGKGTTVGLELVCVLYGVECALTTATCIYDCWGWEGYAWEVKRVLIFQLYMPWALIREFFCVFVFPRFLPVEGGCVADNLRSVGYDGGYVYEDSEEDRPGGLGQEGPVSVGTGGRRAWRVETWDVGHGGQEARGRR